MKEFFIVGSRSEGNPSATYRPDSVDIDVICSYDDWNSFIRDRKAAGELVQARPLSGTKMMAELKSGLAGNCIMEAEVWYDDSDHAYKLAQYIKSACFDVHEGLFDSLIYHAPANVLYMMKMSHRYLKNSPHFQKTRKDILALREAGATIPADLQALYEERMALTYSYSHPRLNVSKESFFTDSVPYVFDHDALHEIVAISGVPAYTYFTTGEVMFSNTLFNQAPKALKLLCGMEEAATLAIERSVEPFGTDMQKAFEMALEKVCTSITSGLFRNFCWENYDQILSLFDADWTQRRFENAKQKGQIKLYASGRSQ